MTVTVKQKQAIKPGLVYALSCYSLANTLLPKNQTVCSHPFQF